MGRANSAATFGLRTLAAAAFLRTLLSTAAWTAILVGIVKLSRQDGPIDPTRYS
jgi:hypothetical protein